MADRRTGKGAWLLACPLRYSHSLSLKYCDAMSIYVILDVVLVEILFARDWIIDQERNEGFSITYEFITS